MSIDHMRPAVELFYDMQKLRIATANRYGPKGEGVEVNLPEEDVQFLKDMGAELKALEDQALKHAAKRLKGIPIYDTWLKEQMGIGPTMAAVILSSIDIERATTASKIWKYVGLDVMRDGRGRRRVKGEKLGYNPWLKTKMVGVLADIFMKMAVLDEEGRYVRKSKGVVVKVYDEKDVWRRFYDNYKHRKESQQVSECMGCKGTGKVKKEPCGNCGGTGGPAPWGASPGHRDRAAKRYMIKQFLLELWKRWREIEGLEVRPSYQEQYLGHAHAS